MNESRLDKLLAQAEGWTYVDVSCGHHPDWKRRNWHSPITKECQPDPPEYSVLDSLFRVCGVLKFSQRLDLVGHLQQALVNEKENQIHPMWWIFFFTSEIVRDALEKVMEAEATP